MKEAAALLIDIHGQHENQDLLHPDAALKLTDVFGGDKLAAAYAEYKKLYDVYVALEKHLRQLEEENEQQDLLLDRYAWEIKEISEANLKLGEEEGLEEEARLLQNSERIICSVILSARSFAACSRCSVSTAAARPSLTTASATAFCACSSVRAIFSSSAYFVCVAAR